MTTLTHGRSAVARIAAVIGVLVLVLGGGVGLWYLRSARVEGLIQEQLDSARVAREQGDWASAANYLGRYLQRRPEDKHAWLEMADLQMKVRPVSAGTMRAACEGYKQVLRALPTDPTLRAKADPADLRAKLARLYRALGDAGELAFVAEQQLEAVPGDPVATVWKAESLLRRQQRDEAVRLLRSMLEQPNAAASGKPYVEACILMAGTAHAQSPVDGYAAAREWIERAVAAEAAPGPACVARLDLLWTAAAAARGAQQAELAEELRQELTRLETQAGVQPMVRLRVAELLMNGGAYGRAAKILTELAAVTEADVSETFVDPDEWQAALLLTQARLVLDTRERPAADALAERLLSALPKPSHQLRALPSAARLKLLAGDVPAARRFVERFATERGTSKESEDELRVLDAEVKLAEQRPFEAIGLLEPLLAADPTGAARWARPLRDALAEAYLVTGQADRALPLLGELAKRQPNEMGAQKRLIDELLAQDLVVPALDLANAAEARFGGDTELLEQRLRAQLGVARREPQRVSDADLQRVADDIEKLIQSDPQRAGGYLLKSLLASMQGRPADATAALEAALTAVQPSAGLMLELARAHIRNDDFASAERVARDVAQKFPADPDGWSLLAKLEFANQRGDAAEQTLKQGITSVDRAPERYALERQMAELLFRLNRPADGLAILTRLAGDNPNDRSVRDELLRRPEVLADAGQTEALTRELRQIEGERGLLWRVHEARRMMKQDDWRKNEARLRELLEFCVTARPRWVEAGMMLGQLYERLDRLADAEATYRRYVDAPGLTSAVVARLREVMIRQGHYDQLVEILAGLRGRLAEEDLTRIGVSVAFASGDLDGAIERLRNAAGEDGLRQAEEFAALAYTRFLDQGDPEPALAALEQAAAAKPDSMAILTTRLLVLRAAGRNEQGVELVNKHVEANPQIVAAYELRAGYLESIGQREAALRDLERITELAGAERGAVMRAELYWRADDRDAAINALQHGLNAESDSQTLKRFLARALLGRGAAGDRAAAEALVNELAEAQAGELQLLRAALLLTDPDDTNDIHARPLLEKAISAEPTDPEGYLQLATLLARQGDVPAAVAVISDGLRFSPGDVRLLMARASLASDPDESQRSRETVERILERDPANTTALALLADLVLRSGDLTALARQMERLGALAQSRPELDRVRVAHAAALANAGRPQDAVANYPPEICVAAADFLGRTDLAKRPEESERLYTLLVEAKPEFVDARMGLAALYLAQSNPAGAIPQYRAVIERQPKNTEALNNLAWLLAEHQADQAESLAEALRCIDAAVAVQPDNPNLHDTRGHVLARTPERQADARAAFERGLELAAPNSAVRAQMILQLGRLRAAAGELAGFEPQLREAQAIDRELRVFSPSQQAEIAGWLGG